LEEAQVHQGTKCKKKEKDEKKEEKEEEEEKEESTPKVVAVITVWSERKIHILCLHVCVHNVHM
jgi:predicted RNA-binding protein